MLLAGAIWVPDETAGLLLDMDGVLFDTLTMSHEIASELLAPHSPQRPVTREMVRANFAYAVPHFWRELLTATGVAVSDEEHRRLADAHDGARRTHMPAVLDGVVALLRAARAKGLTIAVVSSSPTPTIEALLTASGLREHVTALVGDDIAGVRSKPHPDPYLRGAALLGVAPERCAAIEDSLWGARAAHTAGCYTIGVATGASSLDELEASSYVDHAYPNLLATSPATPAQESRS